MDVAARLVEQGIGVTVVDPRWVRPVAGELVALAAEHRLVVTVEDGVRAGGFGSALADALRDADVRRRSATSACRRSSSSTATGPTCSPTSASPARTSRGTSPSGSRGGCPAAPRSRGLGGCGEGDTATSPEEQAR